MHITFTLCIYTSPIQEQHEHDDASEIRELWISLLLGMEFPQLVQMGFLFAVPSMSTSCKQKIETDHFTIGLRTRG